MQTCGQTVQLDRTSMMAFFLCFFVNSCIPGTQNSTGHTVDLLTAFMEIKHDKVRSEGVFFLNSFEKLKYIVSQLSERRWYFTLHGGNVGTHRRCWWGRDTRTAGHSVLKGRKFRAGARPRETANPAGAVDSWVGSGEGVFVSFLQLWKAWVGSGEGVFLSFLQFTGVG